MNINILPQEETGSTDMPWNDIARCKQYCFQIYHCFVFQINTVFTFGYSSFISTYIILSSLKWALVIKNQKGWRGVQETWRCGTGLTAGEWFIFFWHYMWIMYCSKIVLHTIPIGGLNIKYVKWKKNITLQKWYIELHFV